ncbi:MAG: DUF4266 domain-containing protein [Calditrichia bacterium]
MKWIKSFLILCALGTMLSSCASVKPYQKAHLNQEDMKLSSPKIQTYEHNFETYREGASGANGGKVGGGCGCN